MHKNIISKKYQDLVASKAINEDVEQQRIVKILDNLLFEVNSNLKEEKSFFSKIFSSKNDVNIKGFYLWGGVGRGKSMLMDLFFESCEIPSKRRVHFHSFMAMIHKEIHKWRQEKKHNSGDDPISPLAKNIANESKILCFDEFQVTDIADAMILGRLFDKLFEKGVVVFATSNRPINHLYKDGLQRERFLPFLDLFNNKMNELEIKSQTDYRLAKIKSLSISYRYPLDASSDKFLLNIFNNLINNAKFETKTLKVNGRELIFNKYSSKAILTSFDELCNRPLGASDYIAIAQEFDTILLANIPKLTAEYRNEAKRFVTLIDELYEHDVKLICTAAASPDELYVTGDGSFEFERTVSRLKEMQSSAYINKGE